MELTKIDPGEIGVRDTGFTLFGGLTITRLLLGRYRHLTNFDECRLVAYRAAIDEYKENGGAAEFLLSENAYYYAAGEIRPLENHHSLWVDENCGDLSAFWRSYEQKRDLQDAGCICAPIVKTENGHKKVVSAKKQLTRRESEFRTKIIQERHYNKADQRWLDKFVAESGKTFAQIYNESYRIGTRVRLFSGNLNVIYKHKTSGGSFSTTEFYGFMDKLPIGTIIAFDGDFYTLEMDCDMEYNKTSDDFKTVLYVRQDQIICKI